MKLHEKPEGIWQGVFNGFFSSEDWAYSLAEAAH